MALPSSGELSLGDINEELGRSRTSEISLNTAENGGYVAINVDSVSRPSSTNPATVSEWYSYNHSALPPESDLFGIGSSTAIACSDLSSPTTLYWSTGAFGVGVQLFTNSILTNPVTANYVAWNGDTTVYELNGSGTVISNTGFSC